MEYALEARGIVKRFPGITANNGVDLALAPGEIHAVLGENGAGKTTLMNILYGLTQPDEGEIRLRGRPVVLNGPRQAINLGLGMVHQHFMLVPVMTVTENVILGREGHGPWLRLARAEKRVAELAHTYSLAVDPAAPVSALAVGERQRVEILKALYRDARILILDEPTAVLTPEEADNLFTTLRAFRDQGRSVLFITHKLKEVLRLADRITVLRSGRVVARTTPDETTEAELATWMVGRTLTPPVRRMGEEADGAAQRAVVLDVRDIEVRDDRRLAAVQGVNLRLHAGEIYGLAGVTGNGQTELVEALVGLRPLAAGRVLFLGEDIRRWPVRKRLENGLGHVPEDRHRYGLVESFSAAENLVLSDYRHPPYSKGLRLQSAPILARALDLAARFDIRLAHPAQPVQNLSGGNQQKLIVARELSRRLKVLVAAQPTRGLDVGSTHFIHERILAKAAEGTAVLLVSTELDEILFLADRIGVMVQGRITAERSAAGTTREELGLLMAGSAPAVEESA